MVCTQRCPSAVRIRRLSVGSSSTVVQPARSGFSCAGVLGVREVGLLVALLRPSSSGVASRRHEFAGRAYGVRRTVTGIRIGTRRCAFMERKMYRGVTAFSRDGMHQDSSYCAPVPFVGRCEPGCDCGLCRAKAARRASPFFVVYPARFQRLIPSDPFVRSGTMLR